MQKIEFSEKQKVGYCISEELRNEQIKINIAKVKDRVMAVEHLINEPIAIVGFAPSLNATWEEIKKYKYIMTCSGAHKFLVERGIIPTYHLDLDPRSHKVGMLGQPQKETQYLIASTIHPNYLDALQGFNVKLWHIFANEAEAARILPRGEWMLSGGSSVGSRCMTMARFLGFTDLHIFGMDGSMTETQSHTTEHPNRPKESFETEYEGNKYLTTPSMLFVAKETFHELDQLADVTATFYGEGLIQDMAKNYKPNPKHGSLIAFNKPELISKEAIELNWRLHQENPTYGMGGSKHAETVLKMAQHPDIKSVLDYGCGKSMLAKSLPMPIWEYDPAIPEKSELPKPADLVVCTDVMEHIEVDKLQFVLDDLKRCIKQVGYFVISTRKAVKTYANGANTHSIVQGKNWWHKQLSKYFEIASLIEKEKECELHIVVSPKKIVQPEITTVENDGTKVKFYTPNDTTQWRANTVFTKEPTTVAWIKQMQPGEVLFDIGANVGSYSILAGVKGVKVYSFEPEAENYALLVKNMLLNGIEPNAYCLAISDEEKAGLLYGGKKEAGGACHSFGEQVGYDLAPRQAGFTQGCFGMPLDKMIENGLPHPHHLKIDVDGFEFKVIKGATNILANGLKSILVEVNTNLDEHNEMVRHLCELGFTYDEAQVENAKRKDGAFKGVAEYVFTKKQRHSISEIDSVSCCTGPYNHIYIDNFFSPEVYKKIQEALPGIEYEEIEKTRGTKGYPKRFTGKVPEFLYDILCDGSFKKSLLEKFGIVDDNYSEDILLVRDYEGYAIPPHTDSTSKIITVLIYLPEDNSLENEGTAIYVPKVEGFICKKGLHYNFEDFNKVKTMPFRPNSMFAFARTDNSFHGVAPSKGVRNVLLYNIKK